MLSTSSISPILNLKGSHYHGMNLKCGIPLHRVKCGQCRTSLKFPIRLFYLRSVRKFFWVVGFGLGSVGLQWTTKFVLFRPSIFKRHLLNIEFFSVTVVDTWQAMPGIYRSLLSIYISRLWDTWRCVDTLPTLPNATRIIADLELFKSMIIHG